MARWVLDANVVVKWSAVEDLSTEADFFHAPEHELFAPDIILWEVTNVLIGKAQQRLLLPEDAFSALPIMNEIFTFYDSEQLRDEAMNLAMRAYISVFDALYLLVALTESCPLVTNDASLIRATRDRYGDVVVPLVRFREEDGSR